MKTIVKHLMAAAVAAACATTHAGSLEISPASSTVNLGQNFSISVVGRAFTETIVGGGFNLAFNPAVLQFQSIGSSIAPIWEFLPTTGLVNNVAGTLTNASFNTFVNFNTGNFPVATLNFTAIQTGLSGLTLSPSAIFDFSDLMGNLVTPLFVAGSVTVVPEAGGFLMMLLGVAAMRLLHRRSV